MDAVDRLQLLANDVPDAGQPDAGQPDAGRIDVSDAGRISTLLAEAYLADPFP